ncbi:MAG: PRD domain-containing protein [Sporolactobacillus sp.]|jgi:transcriptional antiterminator|nr:PRD domain-containing protein [Sporolactobacillus sp.]
MKTDNRGELILVQLSERKIQIMVTLLNSKSPLTTGSLAEKYGVSVRTIKYDLHDLRIWLKQWHQNLQSQANAGVWFEGNTAVREQIKLKLLGRQNFEYYPDSRQRAIRIAFLLLLASNPIKIQKFESVLSVSKTTIVNSFERIKRSLQPFNVQLTHHGFYGNELSGRELDIRSYFESLLQQQIGNFGLDTLVNLLQGEKSRKGYMLTFLLNKELAIIFQRVLVNAVQIATKSAVRFNDNDLLTIIIRLTISVARLNSNRMLNSYQEIKQQLGGDKDIVLQIFEKIFRDYDYPLYEDEYTYVANGGQSQTTETNFIGLTEAIINHVSSRTGFPFNQDDQLRVNLLTHLTSKLSGRYRFTNEYSPFTDDIKKKHPELFAALTEACREKISVNPSLVNDSFVSYLALHFLVSWGNQHRLTKKVRLVYVCSTGLGVTNLIQQRIKESITNIEIAGFTSVINFQRDVKKFAPDLVISIFPLKDSPVPVIQVNPLPSAEDIEKIKNAVNQLLGTTRYKPFPEQVQGERDSLSLKNYVRDSFVQAFLIYQDLKKVLSEQLPEYYRDAFLLHVMMLIYRIHFHEQYEDIQVDSKVPSKKEEQIKAVFNKYDLAINPSEINAILVYTTFGSREMRAD